MKRTKARRKINSQGQDRDLFRKVTATKVKACGKKNLGQYAKPQGQGYAKDR